MINCPLNRGNSTLNRVAYRAGRLVAAGALAGKPTAGVLEAAGIAVGLLLADVRATVRSGLQAGQANPAVLPDSGPWTRSRTPSQPPVVPPAAPESATPPRPPQVEVDRLWSLSRPVLDDPDVTAWLLSRAIPADRVELHDLARAIPADASIPRWAACQRVPWTAHHRLIARGWGATGTAESLHARAAGELPEGLPKGLWPAAGPGSARGLVLSDGWGRQLIATGRRPEGWRGEMVVAEGVPDWLVVATNYSDSDEDAPAVLGVTAGSWTLEIASRVPDGTRVVIATDPDEAGDKYAQKIAATFQGRNCELRRWSPR